MASSAIVVDNAATAMEAFSPATRTWFTEAFERPTEVQASGWTTICSGAHSLLLAPTGSGKTLAAFLWGIDRVARLDDGAPPGVRVLYVSPLKALVHDVERNLRAPLRGIERTAERLGLKPRDVRVDVRTGDTSQRDRRRQRVDPAEILVTTPESLFLLLGSEARATFATVHTVIVDEVHAVAATKRGVHLALSLERLAELAVADPQRIGLSATVRPVDEVARFLGGDRPVEVVDAQQKPRLALSVAVPVPDMERPAATDEPAPDSKRPPAAPAQRGGPILGDEHLLRTAQPARRHGLWSAIHPELLRLVREHRSTILFVNSRSLCERLTQHLNELAEEELVLAHHGSISHEQRREIEEALKAGKVRGLVATSSLELGIDMGAVDLVVLVESPGSVARGLQRVGRAGHGVGEVSQGRIFPKFRGDLLECAAIAQRMATGELESLQVPRNALDVLAQQVIAMVCDRERGVDEIGALVRRSAPYRELSPAALTSVLDMLTGRYPSEDFADLRPRLAWDRTRNVLSARRGTQMISRLNAGTIPDRGQFAVHLGADGPRLGELDEEMVTESSVGDVILLGASSWRIVEITRDRVHVEPAPGESGSLPFWRGDGPGRPIELGRAIGALTRKLDEEPPQRARELLAAASLDEFAAENLLRYVAEQKEHTGALPTDRAVTVERFRDELGDWRICILTPFGNRVHAPWSLALQTILSARSGFEVAAMYGDDGIVLTFADGDQVPDVDVLFPDPTELEELVTDQLTGSALFGASFRENAARALLLPRRNPRARSPLWAQRLKAKNLMAGVLRYPDFPIVLETYRQCLRDVFDLPALEELLRGVRSREVQVDYVETRGASPFARSLVFEYVAAYLYEYDQPFAERRAHALGLDRELLRELLGETELRELIDADVLRELEAELQRLAPERHARDADELHDVLRWLGACTEDELRARCTEDPRPWLERLERERRAVSLRVSGGRPWIAAQDAGAYEAALGAVVPGGLPAEFLEAGPDALERLVRRYARTRGPFQSAQLAQALGLAPERTEAVLETLRAAGVLVRGAIRPGGSGLEWCDEDVLRRLRRRTLAKLRGEIAPVEAPALARFLGAWHGLGRKRRRGAEGLEDAIAQLEGCPLPWSTLAGEVLPARVAEFAPEMLDALSASGRVVWVGRAALGAADGRVVLLRRESAPLLLDPPEPYPDPGPLHTVLLDTLEKRGACFATELSRALRSVHPDSSEREFEAALWDLVWAGLVTNDTFLPLRSLASRSKPRRGRGTAPLAGGRWSLVRNLLETDTPPERVAHARATTLLERYGVVAREMALEEEVPGGFTAVYRVLKAMEEAGRIRRGHFVEGLGGVQFALAGAVDRLRDAREPSARPEVRVLAAADPANPWGGVLPWPATGDADRRPRRVAGAHLVTVEGRPVLYVSPSRRSLLTFPESAEPAHVDLAIEALKGLPGRSLVLERIDGVRTDDSGLRDALTAHGFASDYRGWILVRRATRA